MQRRLLLVWTRRSSCRGPPPTLRYRIFFFFNEHSAICELWEMGPHKFELWELQADELSLSDEEPEGGGGSNG